MEGFQGFTEDCIQFFWGIRFNNERAWFQANKSVYEEKVLAPLRCLAEEVYDRFLEENPRLPLIMRVSRIYRDARRLHGRGPYKSNMWFTLRAAGEDWARQPAFWFGIDPEGWDYGLGMYQAAPSTMALLRQDIDREGKEIVKLARGLERQTRFRLSGEEYKRPKGSPPAPLDRWYNRKTLTLACTRPVDELLYSPDLVDELLEGFQSLLPYYHYFQGLCSREGTV